MQTGDRPLLLFFHGGLALYLFLHGFVLPLIANLGQGNHPLASVQLYFLPHIFLWLSFYHHQSENSPVRWGLFYFWIISLVVAAGGIFDLYQQINSGLLKLSFSTAIIEISQLIFICIFWIRFKSQYNFHFNHRKVHGFIAIVAGLLFWGAKFVFPVISPKKLTFATVKNSSIAVARINLNTGDIQQMVNEPQVHLHYYDGVLELSPPYSPIAILRLEQWDNQNQHWKLVKTIIEKTSNLKEEVSSQTAWYRIYCSPDKKWGHHLFVPKAEKIVEKTILYFNHKIEDYIEQP